MIYNIFRGKKVLVTGHTGFKGSWLALWLSELGADVYGYSLAPETDPNHYTVAKISERLESECINDIRDQRALADYIRRIKPDCIFHLAAQPIVRRSYAEPAETFESNVMGSIYLMDAVRLLTNPCSVVMITSDKCYENTGKREGYTETDPMGGYDPYSASKGCAELAIAAYRRSFFGEKSDVNIASVRAGNVIGGGDWAEDRIIPDAVRAVVSGKELYLRNPSAIRPWQHVLEPLSGYLLLAAKMLSGDSSKNEGWNFGPVNNSNATPSTVMEIINMFYSHWRKGKAVYDPVNLNLHEAAYLTLSSEKSEKLLGWKQQWNLSETINRTADWYMKFYEGHDATELSLCDINDYSRNLRY